MTKILLAAVVVCSVATAYAVERPQGNRAAPGSVSCIPYDPANLKLTDAGAGTWMLERADGAKFRVFANRPDAEAGLAVFKEHSSLCYIGRGSASPNHTEYVMEFFR